MKQTAADKKIEEVIRVLETPELMTKEMLEEWLRDKDKLQAGKSLYTLRRALAYSEGVFSADKPHRIDVRYTRRRKLRRIALSLLTVAAVIIGLLIGKYRLHTSETNNENKGVQVLAKTESTGKITLSTDKGELIDLSKPITTGKADIIRANARSLVYQPEKAMEVEMHTLRIPRGHDYHVVLSDGTKVWLNAESTLVYPSDFRGGKREVQLVGEAYFEVKADKECPFIVHTSRIKTTVYGTEFNIDAYQTAWPRVALISGSVSVADTQSGHETNLVPGQEAAWHKSGVFKCKEINTDVYMYRRDGYFYFDALPLEEMMCEIGRWYNLNVRFLHPSVMNEKIHFVMKRSEPINQVISFINKLEKCKVSLEEETLIIR